MELTNVLRLTVPALCVALTGCAADSTETPDEAPPVVVEDKTTVQPALAGYIGGLFGAGSIAGGAGVVGAGDDDDLLRPSP